MRRTVLVLTTGMLKVFRGAGHTQTILIRNALTFISTTWIASRSFLAELQKTQVGAVPPAMAGHARGRRAAAPPEKGAVRDGPACDVPA